MTTSTSFHQVRLFSVFVSVRLRTRSPLDCGCCAVGVWLHDMCPMWTGQLLLISRTSVCRADHYVCRAQSISYALRPPLDACCRQKSLAQPLSNGALSGAVSLVCAWPVFISIFPCVWTPACGSLGCQAVYTTRSVARLLFFSQKL